MASYLLIESRDLFESKDCGNLLAWAHGLLRGNKKVTLFLIQNGVLAARKGPESRNLSRLAEGGAEVLADAFSLRERGVREDQIAGGIQASPLDAVLDRMAEGYKALWH